MKAILLVLFGIWASAASISYDLELSVSADGTFHGKAQVTFPCPSGTDPVFRLYPNHFGPFISLTSAWVDNLRARWETLDPTVLVVLSPQGCQQTVTVTLEFRGEVPAAAPGYGIFRRQKRTMTMAQFYPVLAPWREGWVVHPTFSFGDNLVAEVADYVLTVSVPPGWMPVGSGQEEELAPGLWRLTGGNLREMGLVLVRDFAERRLAHPCGVQLRVLFPPELGAAANQALNIAAEALSLLTQFLGSYPYADLDMVFVPLWGAGGVEYPQLILIGWDYAYHHESDVFAEIVVHELAHQWWYGEVGTDQVAEPWLDEGLATYTSSLYFAARGKFEEKVQEWEARWRRARELFPGGSVGDALWGFAVNWAAQRSYSGYVYSGAALFLQEVRRLLGDAQFFAALRRFREEHRWGLALASRLLDLLREAGGPPLEALLTPYFRP